MKRRDLLKVAPTLALAGAVPAAAASPNETPIMALFREWKAAQEAEDAAYLAREDDLPNDEAAQFADIRRAIEKRMMATPCEDGRDWVCKVAAYTAFGIFALEEDYRESILWAEARALIGGQA